MKNYFIFIFILAYSCKTTNSNSVKDANILLKEFTIIKYKNVDSLLYLIKKTDSLNGKEYNSILNGINQFFKANYFNITSKYDLALKYVTEMQTSLTSSNNYDSLIAVSHLLKGEIYTNLNNYEESIKSLLLSKQLFEKIGKATNPVNIAIARAYQSKGEIQKAKEILTVKNNFGNPVEYLNGMHILANIYGEMGEIDSALQIDNSIISQYYDSENKRLLSPFYNNKALCLNEKKQYDSALIYFKKSIALDSADGNIKNIAANYDDIGASYLSQNKVEIAKNYFYKSIATGKQIKRKALVLSGYKNLYTASRKIKDYESAILLNDTIKILQKELDNVNLNSRIEELNLVYETSKKERQIEVQKISLLKKMAIV